MIDIKVIRDDSERVKKGVSAKQVDIDIDELLSLDEKRRKLLKEIEDLKKHKNDISQEVGKKLKNKEDATSLINDTKLISQNISKLEPKVENITSKFDDYMINIPNLPHKSVPIGKDAKDNEVVKNEGAQPKFSFKPKNHIELMEELSMIDFKMSSKISGSGFALYRGMGARLERALISYMIDFHIREHGYTEVIPPYLVNQASMIGTGQLPKLKDDMYHLEEDDLYLIPTAEVPVTNMYRDHIFDEEDLPLYFVAHSGCYRREAGSYGKDVKGLQRLHQFNKVELVKFVTPETSYEEHDKLLLNAEKIIQSLGLPYRVLLLSSGDMSFAAAKCYDIELYAPGEDRWLEVSSCSNFEDFQARRAHIKFKPKGSKKSEFVHTLNGSGVALPRLVIAIIENYQNEDGTITIPPVLRTYFDGAETIGK